MKCSYKKISALILALMMLLSVTGCTDNSASSLPGEKPSVYPFVNTLKEPDDNAMQAVSAGTDRTGQAKSRGSKSGDCRLAAGAGNRYQPAGGANH